MTIVRCAASCCENTALNNTAVKFHKFPLGTRSLEWARRVNRQDLIPLHNTLDLGKRHLYLCSVHFDTSMYTSSDRIRLSGDAVPSFTTSNVPSREPSATGQVWESGTEHAPELPVDEQSGEFASNTGRSRAGRSEETGNDANCTEPPIVPGSSQQRGRPRCKEPPECRIRKLQKGLRQTRAKLRAAEANNETLRQELNAERTKSQYLANRSRRETLLDNGVHFSELVLSFIDSQIQNLPRVPKAREYSENDKLLALTVFMASTLAYEKLAQNFALPSVRQLQRWLKTSDVHCGFSQLAVVHLRSLLSRSEDPKKKILALCVDEMSLKKHLFYDKARDMIFGYENTGEGKGSAKLAETAIVFMVRSLEYNWKLPFGYALVSDSLPGDAVSDLLKKCLDKLQESGADTRVIVSDQGSNLSKAASSLGATFRKPYFNYKGKKYIYMYDPPHLIKSVRNNLEKYTIKFGEHRASWKDIVAFHLIDKKRRFRLAPRLTPQHIPPAPSKLSSFAKMRVRLTTQTLSHSVSVGVRVHVSEGILSNASLGTAIFAENFDRLFDIFNSSTFLEKKTYRRPFDLRLPLDKNPLVKELYRLREFLESVRVVDETKNIDVTNRIRCFNGWIHSINALLEFALDLRKLDFTHIHTRRLNQDCLENFFGRVRRLGGWNLNPTAQRFFHSFKRLLCVKLMDDDGSLGANCSKDEGEFSTINNETTASSGLQPSQGHVDTEGHLPVSELDLEPRPQLAATCSEMGSAEQYSFEYFVGYVAKRVLEEHDCDICRAWITSEGEGGESLQSIAYFNYKAYDNRKEFGGLLKPCPELVAHLHECENLFSNLFPKICHKPQVL